MSVRIAFEQYEEKNLAVFRYESLPRFLTALFISLPITAFFLYLLLVIFTAGVSNSGDLLFILAAVFVYGLLITGSNMFQAPLLNPQWIFTSVRSLKIKDRETGVFQRGIFPLCFRSRFRISDIGEIRLARQKCGRGLGFFLYIFSPPALYSLTLILRNDKKYYLSDNETRNGLLADEGRKLAEYLNVPFKESN